jgi:hypothetical protein
VKENPLDKKGVRRIGDEKSGLPELRLVILAVREFLLELLKKTNLCYLLVSL